MSAGDLRGELDRAMEATRAAGARIMGAFRTGEEVRYKSPDQPVTDADLSADRLLRERLIRAFPSDGWLSEETADSPERLMARRVWIVDPIDGTRSFVEGSEEFAVSVALAVDGRAVLGIVHAPAMGETYHALLGGGAYRNGVRLETSAAEGGSRALASRSEMARGALDLLGPGWRLRPMGSTALKMVKVGDGTGDLYFSSGPKAEWDVCAAGLLLEELGMVFTDAEGRPVRYNRPDPSVRGVLAGSAEAHARALATIRSSSERGGEPRVAS